MTIILSILAIGVIVCLFGAFVSILNQDDYITTRKWALALGFISIVLMVLAIIADALDKI